MQQDTETRKRLIDSACAEFVEKGYAKTSLRTVCSNAGVTTGALYFFFDDKADLFRAVVGDYVESLYSMIDSHFREDLELIDSPDYDGSVDDHSKFAQELIHHIYGKYDIALLLLNKSQGSEYEDLVERLIALIEDHCNGLTEAMVKKGFYKKKVNKTMSHLLICMIFDSFVRLVRHEPEEKKAVAGVKKIFKMTMSNWTEVVFE